MAERRYNQDEVAAIFERASKNEADLPPASGTGLTLAEVHDIAREVGISPELISHAAQSLDMPAAPATAKLLGLPIGVARTVEFNRAISDPEWEMLVADLRTTFNAPGRLRHDGAFRQWSNGNLRVLLEPTPSGSRLRLQTLNADARGMMMIGLIFTGAAAAALIASNTAAGATAGSFAGFELMGMAGIGFFSAGALRVSGWARRRANQFEEVIGRLVRGPQ